MTTKRPWLEPSLSRQLVCPLLACAPQFTQNSAALCEIARLDALTRMPLSELVGLLHELEVEPDGQALGARAAAQASWSGGDLLHYLTATASTVGEGLLRLVRYAALVHEAAQFQLHARDGMALLRLGTCAPLGRTLSDFLVIGTCRRVMGWTGSQSGFEVWFQHGAPRSCVAHADALPHVRLRFDAPGDALLFDARLLDVPMPGADAELHRILVEKAEKELEGIPTIQSLGHHVRGVLLEELHAGYVDCVWVAARLGLSRRSLSRHLKEERTSYTAILNSVRREVSRHLLVRTRLSIQEIATRLGYSLTGAFTRAFRRLEGTNPVSYRRLHAGDVLGASDTPATHAEAAE